MYITIINDMDVHYYYKRYGCTLLLYTIWMYTTAINDMDVDYY